MGLFDFWMSEDQRIARQQRILADRNQQAEDREKAARALADMKSPKAVVALLTRFDVSLENGLKDKAEKEFLYDLLKARGDDVLRPLDRHLEKCRSIALPLRLYVELKGEAGAIEKLFQVLEHERAKDDFHAQKKLDILVWLAERRHPGAIAAATPFLEDFDEGVRYAAAEVIANQQDDAGRAPLDKAICNPSEDSNRLKVRLADIFAQRRWPVSDPAKLPAGYSLRDGRVIAG